MAPHWTVDLFTIYKILHGEIVRRAESYNSCFHLHPLYSRLSCKSLTFVIWMKHTLSKAKSLFTTYRFELLSYGNNKRIFKGISYTIRSSLFFSFFYFVLSFQKRNIHKSRVFTIEKNQSLFSWSVLINIIYNKINENFGMIAITKVKHLIEQNS